ncbi:MAG TPA: error-prone DNA polymerase, partial [Planctomycetota bacterium]|nr:error-prone DNA polymerase [Planctomycetota bacterium]
GDTPRDRRAALWQVSAIERDTRSLFAGESPPEREPARLGGLSALEVTLADYRLAGITTGPQVMAHLRERLRARGVMTAEEVRHAKDGSVVRTAGHVIVRQRPGSAKGFLFLTLEDETGLSNAIMTPKQVARFRVPLHASALLEIAGPVQNVDGVVHVKLRHLAPLGLGADGAAATSADAVPEGRSYR